MRVGAARCSVSDEDEGIKSARRSTAQGGRTERRRRKKKRRSISFGTAAWHSTAGQDLPSRAGQGRAELQLAESRAAEHGRTRRQTKAVAGTVQ